MTKSKSSDIGQINRQSKNNILNKLKQQVSGADYSKLPEETAFTYPELTLSEQIEQFILHLKNNHAQVIKTSHNQLADNIKQQLNERGISTLLYGANSSCADVVESIADVINIKPFDFSIDDNKKTLFDDFPAAVSSSRGAISATGSIVLWPDKNEPRTLSLVPPVHFVVVDARQMYPDFISLIKHENWQHQLPTNVVLISGPSKTADIQQTLAYGAHGPKELIVLLINS